MRLTAEICGIAAKIRTKEMAKNEYGYPCMAEMSRAGNSPEQNGDARLGGTGNGSGGCAGRSAGGTEGRARTGDLEANPSCNRCGGRGDCIDLMKPGYVYAHDQKFRLLYSAKDALSHGTLFEELYKPMGVYGNEHTRKQ